MILPRRVPAPATAKAAATAAVLSAALALAAGPAAGATVAAAAPPAGCTGHPSATWLNVAVQGVRSSQGLIAVTLYPDSAGRFLVKHGSLYTGRVPARAGTTVACLFVPVPGTYAFVTYHDENGNRKLDRSALGLPDEGFGFSNNPSTVFGIPAFRTVRLSVPRAGLTTRIALRYP